MEITPEIQDRLDKLHNKYGGLGQDLLSYLDGLLYADVTTYWDYIQIDTLLTLQKPKTNFPDEVVFIIYHQITELYFKLALREYAQIGKLKKLNKDFFIARVSRINRYFDALINSFDIMVSGMEKEQFSKFRMSLLPASGFQSAQYREIEIYSTDFINLVSKDKRELFNEKSSIKEMFEEVYWKHGATEVETQKKTLTLSQFEDKYKEHFIKLGEKCRKENLWSAYLRLSKADQQDPEVIKCLKDNDSNVNINWPLVHYKSAVKYLSTNNNNIAATGGTNWQKYLPPKFQKRIFYPLIWSKSEKEHWGKGWVEKALS